MHHPMWEKGWICHCCRSRPFWMHPLKYHQAIQHPQDLQMKTKTWCKRSRISVHCCELWRGTDVPFLYVPLTQVPQCASRIFSCFEPESFGQNQVRAGKWLQAHQWLQHEQSVAHHMHHPGPIGGHHVKRIWWLGPHNWWRLLDMPASIELSVKMLGTSDRNDTWVCSHWQYFQGQFPLNVLERWAWGTAAQEMMRSCSKNWWIQCVATEKCKCWWLSLIVDYFLGHAAHMAHQSLGLVTRACKTSLCCINWCHSHSFRVTE